MAALAGAGVGGIAGAQLAVRNRALSVGIGVLAGLLLGRAAYSWATTPTAPVVVDPPPPNVDCYRAFCDPSRPNIFDPWACSEAVCTQPGGVEIPCTVALCGGRPDPEPGGFDGDRAPDVFP